MNTPPVAWSARILERTLGIVREGVDEVGIDILGHPTFSPLAALKLVEANGWKLL
jgi:hypothetical protein